jgi:hypothetical protein
MSYNRKAALAYAELFAKRVCHDGMVAARPLNLKFQRGRPFSELKSNGPIQGEDDCTHFISCCVGIVQGPIKLDGITHHLRGGGINLNHPIPGIYGETFTPRAVGQLQMKGGLRIVHPQFMDMDKDQGAGGVNVTRAAIRKNLRTGDLLAYASDKILNRIDGTGHYGHMAMIATLNSTNNPGKVGIACHTAERFDVDFTDVKSFPFVTLLRFP